MTLPPGSRDADSAGADDSGPDHLGRTDPGPSDDELVRRHVAGEPDAFADLFRRHRDRLWGVAIRTLADPEEAADALQDAVISAFRNVGQFRGESAVTTWLHRVVVNACLDRMRRRSVRHAEPLPEDDRAVDPAIPDEADPAELQELQVDILTALQTLNPDQRAAIVLVDMEGYSVEEAAHLLDCAAGTIKSRCARGRARLVPLLSHLDTTPGEQRPRASGNQDAAAGVGRVSPTPTTAAHPSDPLDQPDQPIPGPNDHIGGEVP